MAEEEQQAETEESSGDRKKLIIIILGVRVLIGGSIGGTLLMVGGSDETAEADAETDAEVSETAESSRDDPSYVDLKPAFTVNLAPDDPVGFLQISMQVLTFNDDVAKDLEKHKPLIRNNLLILFGKQDSAELRAAEGKDRLQQSALDIVQTVVNQHGSGGEVDSIYFTSFVMQ